MPAFCPIQAQEAIVVADEAVVNTRPGVSPDCRSRDHRKSKRLAGLASPFAGPKHDDFRADRRAVIEIDAAFRTILEYSPTPEWPEWGDPLRDDPCTRWFDRPAGSVLGAAKWIARLRRMRTDRKLIAFRTNLEAGSCRRRRPLRPAAGSGSCLCLRAQGGVSGSVSSSMVLSTSTKGTSAIRPA